METFWVGIVSVWGYPTDTTKLEIGTVVKTRHTLSDWQSESGRLGTIKNYKLFSSYKEAKLFHKRAKSFLKL